MEKEKEVQVVGYAGVSPYAFPGLLKEQLTLEGVEQVVCAALGVEPAQLSIKTRRRDVCFPRQVVFYFAMRYRHCLRMAERKPDCISGRYGRNHATAYHAVNLMEDLMFYDRSVRMLCDGIEEALRERFWLGAPAYPKRPADSPQ
jgi:chromosomal replication initiation ATPase DnaA